jgi:hypothetical protein
LLKECCDIILSFMTAKATHSCLLNQVCKIEYIYYSKIILFLYWDDNFNWKLYIYLQDSFISSRGSV